MECFVVDVQRQLEGGETKVGGCEEEEEEGSLVASALSGWGNLGGLGVEKGLTGEGKSDTHGIELFLAGCGDWGS